MNYKGLKYRTEWVEFPDIEDVCKKIGAAPTGTKPNDGVTPHYTVPVLYDPSTKVAISDTTNIADYLDKTYPDTPALFPPGTRGLHAAFFPAFHAAVGMPIVRLSVLPTFLYLGDKSLEYFRRTREAWFGKKLEEICPKGEVHEKTWKELEAGLTKVAIWFDAEPFLGGCGPCNADFILASRLLWARTVWGEESNDWQRMKELDGGRWSRYLQSLDEFITVV